MENITDLKTNLEQLTLEKNDGISEVILSLEKNDPKENFAISSTWPPFTSKGAEKDKSIKKINRLCEAIVKNKHIKLCELFLQSPYSEHFLTIFEAIKINQSLDYLVVKFDTLTEIDLNDLKTTVENQVIIEKFYELLRTQKFINLEITISKIDKTHLLALFEAFHTHGRNDLTLSLPLKSMNDECFQLFTQTLSNNNIKVKNFQLVGKRDEIEKENLVDLDESRFKQLIDSLASFKCICFSFMYAHLEKLNQNNLQYIFNMLQQHNSITYLSLFENGFEDMDQERFKIFTNFLHNNKNIKGILVAADKLATFDILSFETFMDALAKNINLRQISLMNDFSYTNSDKYKEEIKAIQRRTLLTNAITNPKLVTLHLDDTSIGKWPKDQFSILMENFSNHPSLQYLYLRDINLSKDNYQILLTTLIKNQKLLEVELGNNIRIDSLPKEKTDLVSNYFKMQRQKIYFAAALTLYKVRFSQDRTRQFPFPIIKNIMSFFEEDKALTEQVLNALLFNKSDKNIVTAATNTNKPVEINSSSLVKSSSSNLKQPEQDFLSSFLIFKKQIREQVQNQLNNIKLKNKTSSTQEKTLNRDKSFQEIINLMEFELSDIHDEINGKRKPYNPGKKHVV